MNIIHVYFFSSRVISYLTNYNLTFRVNAIKYNIEITATLN